MLNDPHFKVLHYEEDATKIFANTEIKGGVAITYRDEDKDFGAIEVFTKYPELNSVLKKAAPCNDEQSLMAVSIISASVILCSMQKMEHWKKNLLNSSVMFSGRSNNAKTKKTESSCYRTP